MNKYDFVRELNILNNNKAVKLNLKPIKLTSKQYEELKNSLGNMTHESDKDRIISSVLGTQIIVED